MNQLNIGGENVEEYSKMMPSLLDWKTEHKTQITQMDIVTRDDGKIGDTVSQMPSECEEANMRPFSSTEYFFAK